MIVVPVNVVDPPTLRLRWTVSPDTVASPETLRVLLTNTLDPDMVVAVRDPKVVSPVTPRVVPTVVACNVVVPSALSPPLEYNDVPEIVAAVRLPNVVRPVTPSVVPTVVACKLVVPSTVSPPEEYSDDPEMVVARRPVREVDPDTLSVPPVYTNTLDAEMFVNDTLELNVAWPDTFKVFRTCTFESVARPAQTFKAEPRIVADPDTSRATVGSLPIPSHIADRSPCKNG